MWTPSERARVLVAFVAFGLTQVAAVSAVLLLAAPPARSLAAARAPASGLAAPALDALRAQSLLGDAEAGNRLAGALLDRYQRTGRTEALFEAVMWIDRGWPAAAPLQGELLQRLARDHCQHEVLRWHWVCNPGE